MERVMKEFINSLNNKYDVKIPLCKEPEKGQNSYSLDKFGNIAALFLNNLNMQNLDFLLPIAEKLEVLSLNNCSIKQIGSSPAFFNLKKLSLIDNPVKQLDNLIKFENLIELNSAALIQTVRESIRLNEPIDKWLGH